MELIKRHIVLGMVGILLVTGLLLVPAPPAQAGADVFFGLTIGVPFAPYPVYAPVYAPPSVIYAYPPTHPVVGAPGPRTARHTGTGISTGGGPTTDTLTTER